MLATCFIIVGFIPKRGWIFVELVVSWLFLNSTGKFSLCLPPFTVQGNLQIHHVGQDGQVSAYLSPSIPSHYVLHTVCIPQHETLGWGGVGVGLPPVGGRWGEMSRGVHRWGSGLHYVLWALTLVFVPEKKLPSSLLSAASHENLMTFAQVGQGRHASCFLLSNVNTSCASEIRRAVLIGYIWKDFCA